MKKFLIFVLLIVAAACVFAQGVVRQNPYVSSVFKTGGTIDPTSDVVVKSLTATGVGSSIFSNGIAAPFVSSYTPFSNKTNVLVDYNIVISDITATNNIYFLYSTNFAGGLYNEVVFFVKGSTNNYTINFGTDFTNTVGAYTTNGYKLGNSNGVHTIAFGIRGARGKEVIAITPPNN